MTISGLRSLWRSDRINHETLVRKEFEANYQALSEVDGLISQLKELPETSQEFADPSETWATPTETDPSYRRGFAKAGWLMFTVGSILILFWWFYDTTGGYGADRVHNTGLLNNRVVGVVDSVGLTIVGSIFILVDQLVLIRRQMSK
jgi:hypothetical protein